MLEERLSAVAKRRRLNGNLSDSVDRPSANTSRSHSPAKIHVIHQPQETSISRPVTNTQDIEVDDENTFSALVDRDVVHFSHFRSVDRVNDQAIKIRLSKGQKCVIGGRYGLWIKEGTIELLGSKLGSSTELHYVYSVSFLDIPAISTTTDVAEIEVLSLDDRLPQSVDSSPFEWNTPNGDIFNVSFFVHGYSVWSSSNCPPQIKESEGTSSTVATHSIIRTQLVKDKDSIPAILCCGKYLAGSASSFLFLLNSITTSRNFNQGILLLDLDSDAPVFGPPGVASIVHISRPILGLPYHQFTPIQVASEADPFKTIRMLYVRKEEDPIVDVLQLHQLLKYLTQLRSDTYAQCPLVIKANGWLERVDSTQATTMMRSLGLRFVVCYGSDTGSISGQVGARIADECPRCQIVDLPALGSRTPPTFVPNEIMMQSYFHFRGYELGRPRWSSLPLEMDKNSRIWLSHGNQDAFVSAIVVQAPTNNSTELLHTLDGCMVAITLHTHEVPTGPTGDTHSQITDSIVMVDDAPNAGHPTGVDCIGFGIVADFTANKVCLLTPIQPHILEDIERRGDKIQLVAVKADPDSGFDTAWVHLELGAIFPDKKPAKTIYRRKLKPEAT